MIEDDDYVIDPIVTEDSPEALDATRARRELSAAGRRVGIGWRDIGRDDRKAILIQQRTPRRGVVDIALCLPFGTVDRRGLDAPARPDSALSSVVGNRARLILAWGRHRVTRVGDGNQIVGDSLVGIVHMVVGTIRGSIQAAVDRQLAALVDGEGPLIQMHV